MSAAVTMGGPRRTWPQRLLIAFNCVLVAACLAAAVTVGYFYERFGQLPRVALPAGVLGTEDPGRPTNFLLVGSDTRAFTEGDASAVASFGDERSVGGQRADTIILIRIDPRAERAAMISFPRDLYVPIAGSGGRGRINTSFEEGPEQLIRTITEAFGIPVHHYVQVDFAGFKGLVDAVDGVEIYLPSPVRDRDEQGNNPSGLDITDFGCVSLTGDQALAYVRSRHFQYLEDGRWKADPTGDLGRITRQQDFIRRAVREAVSEDLLNPAKVDQLVDVGIDNVAVDRNLDARDLVSLGERFRSLSPESLQQFTLPVVADRVNGASVLLLDEGRESEEVLDVFRGAPPDAPETVTPSAVTVRVLNGTGVAGQAGEARDALAAAGFTVAGVGDGPRGTEVTTIRYGPGQAAKAALLSRSFEPDVQLVEDPTLEGVDAVITTGATYAGLLATPRRGEPPEAAASTTQPPPPAADAGGAPAPTVPEC
jgi:LCP family protein required for cell wall assembly